MTQLKFLVEVSTEMARNVMEPDFSMRSSVNMPMSMSSNANINFEIGQKERGISGDF